jgi:hypothetical protein
VINQGNGSAWIVGAGPADPDPIVAGEVVRPAVGIRGEPAHATGDAA